MRGLDLLTQESDAGVREHGSVEGVLALPRAEARMCTGKAPGTFLSEGRGDKGDRGSLRVSSIVYFALNDGQRAAQAGSMRRARCRVTPEFETSHPFSSTSEMWGGRDHEMKDENTYIRQTSSPSYAPLSHNSTLPAPPSSPEPQDKTNMSTRMSSFFRQG